MTTFHVGQQTHQSVLPQRAALESASADTPEGGHETGRGHRFSAVAGVEPGRGEIAADGTRLPRRHPEDTAVSEGANREVHPVVFVLDARGHPLDPCHPARARRLLAAGRAVVVRHTPFVIRLRDRVAADSTVEGVQVGIDPGSKHTGLAVFTDQGGSRTGLYSVQLDHRGGRIRDRLTARAAYRRGRRSRNLRYRAPRFHNRTKPKGWLAPSLRHRVDTTLSQVVRLTRWAPVAAVHVERVSFDTHALSAGKPLEGVEYQQGTLAGYETREYLLAKWGRTCAYCGASGVPLNIDHIHPRSRGGSDRISNLSVACIGCNQAKNATPIEEFLKGRPALLAKILGRRRLHCVTPPPSTPPGGHCGGPWKRPACPFTPPPAAVRSGTGPVPAPPSRTRWTRCTSATSTP